MTIKICANPSIIFLLNLFFFIRIEIYVEFKKKKQIAVQQKNQSLIFFHYLKVSIFYFYFLMYNERILMGIFD